MIGKNRKADISSSSQTMYRFEFFLILIFLYMKNSCCQRQVISQACYSCRLDMSCEEPIVCSYIACFVNVVNSGYNYYCLNYLILKCNIWFYIQFKLHFSVVLNSIEFIFEWNIMFVSTVVTALDPWWIKISYRLLWWHWILICLFVVWLLLSAHHCSLEPIGCC